MKFFDHFENNLEVRIDQIELYIKKKRIRKNSKFNFDSSSYKENELNSGVFRKSLCLNLMKLPKLPSNHILTTEKIIKFLCFCFISHSK